MKRYRIIASSAVLVLMISGMTISIGLGRVTSAAQVRPVDQYCDLVVNGSADINQDGKPDGVGGSGNVPEVCNQNNADKATGDVGLLAQGGIVDRVFKLISWLVGLLAIVFILVGGFKLTTSGGNKDTVKSARNTIIYALVGLAVILLSNLIFNLIIGIAKSAS